MNLIDCTITAIGEITEAINENRHYYIMPIEYDCYGITDSCMEASYDREDLEKLKVGDIIQK